jgi:hypothetical protein
VPLRQQQQQLQQPQQEHSWLSQQHSTLCVSSQPLDLEQQQLLLGSCDELPGDSLDAFMVETQMVSGANARVCDMSLQLCEQSFGGVVSAAVVCLPCIGCHLPAMHWLFAVCIYCALRANDSR